MRKIFVIAVFFTITTPLTANSLDIVGLPVIHRQDDVFKRREIDAVLKVNQEDTAGNWLTIFDKGVHNGTDSVFLCCGFLDGYGQLRYLETKVFGCIFKGTSESNHFHAIIPREIVSIGIPPLENVPGLIRIRQPNGWMWLITAKNQIEAHYLNVRLVPRYRPLPLLGGEALTGLGSKPPQQ
ncbi:MAG: hypothetical protein AAB787_02955 [Patescibacteria group bacterium]